MGRGSPICTGSGQALACYIICMNVNTVVQAMLIKAAGATWSMVVVSFATPLSAFAFACPLIVGEYHVEPINVRVLVASVLITIGTMVYRLGSVATAPKMVEVPDGGIDGYVKLDGGPF